MRERPVEIRLHGTLNGVDHPTITSGLTNVTTHVGATPPPTSGAPIPAIDPPTHQEQSQHHHANDDPEYHNLSVRFAVKDDRELTAFRSTRGTLHGRAEAAQIASPKVLSEMAWDCCGRLLTTIAPSRVSSLT